MTEIPAAHDAVAFMRRALELAAKGWGQTAPNPMVGAVVVRDGKVVGEGYHERFGGPHAEVNALAMAGTLAEGATLYVSLEPCKHHGKTPPCTEAILASGVKKVVVAVLDPTPQASGGAELLKANFLGVDVGMLGKEARELNAPFFHAARSDLPWTTLKLAVSIETAIANERGTTSWLTSQESRAEVHRLRAGSDGIAVGIGTILADDPQLNVRDWDAPRKPPARVIFDRSLRTPINSKVVFTARETPTLIVCQGAEGILAERLRDSGVHLIVTSELRDAFRRLRSAGIRSLLVEGGATLASAVLEEGLVHRLVIFQAPVSLGPEALHAFDGAAPRILHDLEMYPVLERKQLGPDVMTTYGLLET